MINESLRARDLRGFVNKVVEIDNFKSKIGDDEDIVTMAFTVDHDDPAKDLENFIEMGYDFVLDADVSPGELDDGTYKVYVEIERNRHVPKQIKEILDGVSKITGIDNFRFRYFKNFKSQEATEENLESEIPLDRDAYEIKTDRSSLDNFSEFFNNSFAEEITLLDESITFRRVFSGPIKFEILNSGPRQTVYESVKGPIVLEGKDMAEVMFLTKTIGNYNITKISDTFIFENSGWAVALKRK
jgi:hypothetical protein